MTTRKPRPKGLTPKDGQIEERLRAQKTQLQAIEKRLHTLAEYAHEIQRELAGLLLVTLRGFK